MHTYSYVICPFSVNDVVFLCKLASRSLDLTRCIRPCRTHMYVFSTGMEWCLNASSVQPTNPRKTDIGPSLCNTPLAAVRLNFFLPRPLQAVSARKDPAAARRFDGHTLRIKDTTYLGPDCRKARRIGTKLLDLALLFLTSSHSPYTPLSGWLFYSSGRDLQTARVSLVICSLQS